ncbi:hypothetical protein ACF0H5_008422 [Mactra antiquata]
MHRLILLVLCGIFYLHDVDGSCNSPDLPYTVNPSKVARMCMDSVVSGSEVFLDASLANTTTLISTGVACQCTVSTQGVNLVKISSFYDGIQYIGCGTKLEFISQSLGHILGTACHNHVFNVSTNVYTDIGMNLRKVHSPYKSTYCSRFTLDSGSASSSSPLITINCTESPFFPGTTTTTTTSTTTTTPTTTTTTPTTTTTKPTTTTTTSTTTTTPTTTTTTPTTTTTKPTTTTTTPTTTTTTPTTTTTKPTTTTTTPTTTTTTPTTTTTTPTTPTTTTTKTTTPTTKTTTTTTTSTTSTTTKATPTTTTEPPTTKTTPTTITTPTTTTPTTTKTTMTTNTPTTTTKAPTTVTTPTTTPTTTTVKSTTRLTNATSSKSTTSQSPCDPSASHQCSDGKCIPLDWRCDKTQDCADNSDEDKDACVIILCEEGKGFMCNDYKTCLYDIEQCDGVPQCPDNSDENPADCGVTPTDTKPGDEDGLTTREQAVIIGVVCGVIFLLLILGCVLYWRRTKNWNKGSERHLLKHGHKYGHHSSTSTDGMPSVYMPQNPIYHDTDYYEVEKPPPTHSWHVSDKSLPFGVHELQPVVSENGETFYMLRK